MVLDHIRLQIKTRFNYESAYGHQPGEHEMAFEDLNIERQARLVDCFYYGRESLRAGVGNIPVYRYLASKVPDFISDTGLDYHAE